MQTQSKTYRPDGRPLVIQYGTGDMRGALVHDAVQVSTVAVKDFIFGEATYMADFFHQVCVYVHTFKTRTRRRAVAFALFKTQMLC
jgi:hypothetical protein